MKSVSSRRRFTLIELLVTIVIILILVGIMLPMLGKARENARRGACGSNLSQIAVASLAYANDFDGDFPLLATVTETYADAYYRFENPNEYCPLNQGYKDWTLLANGYWFSPTSRYAYTVDYIASMEPVFGGRAYLATVLGDELPAENPNTELQYDTRADIPLTAGNWVALSNQGYLPAHSKAWTCPTARDAYADADHSNYQYLGLGLRDNVSSPDATPVGQDYRQNHDSDFMNTVFADGHVAGTRIPQF